MADLPGDLDLTLEWKPETELLVVPIDDEVSSHAQIGAGGKVHVIPVNESWPVKGSEIHPQGRIAQRIADFCQLEHAEKGSGNRSRRDWCASPA